MTFQVDSFNISNIKFFLDRDGFESHILRFSARRIVKDNIEKERKFVVSYYLSDDTILINQIPEINTGKDVFK